jgi:hypothetical protein
MKRAELYALVWEKPVTHVAKQFGLSDVAIRKICIKHQIPLPPLGYWAKLQHGKKVSQTPLPPLSTKVRESFEIPLRPKPEQPAQVADVRQIALTEEASGANPISVPSERPARLHPIAAATEKALKKAKTDDEGFVSSGGGEGRLDVYIGPESVDRAVLLIHALLIMAVERGHRIPPDSKSRIFVDEQPLAIRIYETKGKATHVPTQSELKKQAEQNEDRRKYPSLYSGDRKVYPLWDYFPSGRLMLEISDPLQHRWKGDPIAGRWRDTSARRLEDRTLEMMVALKVGGAKACYQRAKDAEECRIAKEAEDKRSEQERQKRLLEKVTGFLADKADKYAKLTKLEEFAAFLGIDGNENEEHAELQRAMEFVLVNLRQQLSPASINREIIDKRITTSEPWW